MLDKLVEWGGKVALWATSKPNRLRLSGARIEVIAMVVSLNPTQQVLLGESRYGAWLLPQEGLLLDESFAEALNRCLRDECRIEVPADPTLRRRLFYLHSIQYVDTLDLPEERIGERPVADDAPGTAFESVKLRKKAYWLATLIVKSPAEFPAHADGTELRSITWKSLPDARGILKRTNVDPKASLLTECIDRAGKVLKTSGKST